MGTDDSARPYSVDHPSRTSWTRSGRWGMSFSPPPENSPIPSLPLYETAKPSNSSSTCRTSSPSPREREADLDRGAVASPGFWVRRRTDESPGRGVAHPRQQPAPTSTAGTSWDRFDEPFGHVSSGTIGREPTRRTLAFKIVIVFRGSWCTTSHSLLKGFATLNTTVRRLDGKVLALSSQSPEQVHRVQRELRLPYDVHGDPSNELVEEMNRRFDMGCTITRNEMVLDSYPNGMAQPCILAVHMDSVQDRSSVLYKWSRYQTIGTVRFEDACTEIARALARKTDPTYVDSSDVDERSYQERRSVVQEPRRSCQTALPRCSTPVPVVMPPRVPVSQSRKTGSTTRPRAYSNASQVSTSNPSAERTQAVPRFSPLRQQPNAGAGGGMGGQQPPLAYPQPSPARRRWRFVGSRDLGGIESFSDDELMSATGSMPPTPGCNRGGRPSASATPDSQAYHLGTHQEEDEDDEDDRASGERMDRTVGLPPMKPSNPQPIARGMPGRSARWGSTSRRSSFGLSGVPGGAAGSAAAASSSTSAASSQLPPSGYGQVRWGAPPATAGHRRRESGR